MPPGANCTRGHLSEKRHFSFGTVWSNIAVESKVQEEISLKERIVDVHSHVVPPEYVEALKRAGKLMEDGFPCPAWNVDAHRAYMEKAGIGHCVLSVSSPHQMVGSIKEGLELTQRLNDYMAELSCREPESFSFAACLPLPLVDEAAAEAARALDHLGACAVKMPSNACGLYPGDKRLAPLMDVLNEREAVVFLHPCKPPVVPEGCYTAGPLPLFEFLGDTTRAAINLLVSGVTKRWPAVKYVVPHTGSFLPPLVDRLTGMTQVMAAQGVGDPIDVRSELRHFYFDLAGNALPAALPALLSVTTPDHLLFGGDFPYTPAEMVQGHIRRFRESELTAPWLEDILAGNARCLLKL